MTLRSTIVALFETPTVTLVFFFISRPENIFLKLELRDRVKLRSQICAVS